MGIFQEAYSKGKRNAKRDVAAKVLSRIRKLDPPGRFVELGDAKSYNLVTYERVLEKTCQALREKNCGPPDVFIAKHKKIAKAKRKAVASKRSSRKKKVEEEQTEETSSVEGHMMVDSSIDETSSDESVRKYSRRTRKKIPISVDCHPTTPVKIKKPTASPRAKKLTTKLKTRIHRKDPTPAAKKELFESSEPPKLWKEVLKDIKKPRIESSRTPPDSPVLRRSVSEHDAAVQAKVPTYGRVIGSGHAVSLFAASNSDAGSASTLARMPPHLAAFLGAVFRPHAVPVRDRIDAARMDCGPWGVLEAQARDETTHTKVPWDDSPMTAVGVVEHAAAAALAAVAGLTVPAPPYLEARHSLCVGDDKEDMEVIDEFDPIAAWNSFAEQKKEEW